MNLERLKDSLVFTKLKYINGTSEERRISDETTMYLLSGFGYSNKEVTDIMNAVSSICGIALKTGLAQTL